MGKAALRRLAVISLLGLYFLTLLVPAFKSIPMVPAEGFYIPIWLAVLFFFKPGIFLTKEFFAASIFLIVHVIYLVIGNYKDLDPHVTETQGEIFMSVFFALSMWAYIRIEKDWKTIFILSRAILIFIVLTSMTTIYGLFYFPGAARELIGNDDPEEVRRLLSYNIGSYSFQYLLVIISPIMLYYYKKTKHKKWLGIYFLLLLSVIYAQIFAVILLFALNSALTLILLQGINIKRYVSLVGLIGILYFFGGRFLSIIFQFIGNHTKNFEFLSSKFLEVSHYFEYGGVFDKTEAREIYSYHIQYELSLNSFLRSPITGGEVSGGHHFWMDNLAEHGIVGTFPWIVVFVTYFTSARRFFNGEENILIFNSIVVFILIGLNKNILISTMPVYLFFIVPLFIIAFGENGTN